MYFLCLFCGVYGLSKDEETVVDVLGDEIYDHCQENNYVLVPHNAVAGFGQNGCPPSGKGSEDQVKQSYLCHGDGYIGGGFECKFAVEGEIPHNGKDKGDQVGKPIVQV